METKRCTKCGEVKSLSAFYKGYNYCKECTRIQVQKWRKDNREKTNKIATNYRNNNIDKCRENDRLNYAKNRDKINKYQRDWYIANKSNAKERNKRWVNKNKDIKSYLKVDTQCLNLTDAYIAHALRIPVDDCPAELIEAKRAQLKLHRAINELKD